MKTTKWIAWIVVIIYVLTAVFSNGYHHPDEHFQLIEFAGLKLGWNAPADLAWEYNAKIRPALQPMIAYGVLGILRYIGMESPYLQALVLRLLTMVFAIYCINHFIGNFVHTIDSKHRNMYILLSFLLWFLPAVNVRFSSEVWAGLFLLLGLSLIYKSKKQALKVCVMIGFILGLSFECRYQIALSIVGLMSWMLWTAHWHGKQWLAFVGGGILAVAICTMVDCWFYETLVFAPFEYFRVNILQDVASSYGVFPWHYYFVQILNRPTLLIGISFIFSLCGALVYKTKYPVIWCILPFLIGHSLIPHKELRFLFPLVNFMPLLLIWGYEWVATLINRQVLYLFIVFFCIVNVGGLLMMAYKPAGIGNINMMRYVMMQYANTDMNIYVTPLGNPSMESTFLPIHFYSNERIQWRDYLEEVEKIAMFRSVELKHCAVIVMKVEEERRNFLLWKGFVEEYRSIPVWIEWLNLFYKVYREERTQILYSKEK